MGIRDFLRKGKKEDVVIDLADLEKRGIYKPGHKKETSAPFSGRDSGVIDLTQSTQEDSSPLGFLGSLAGASSENQSGTEISSFSETSATFVSTNQKQKLKEILRQLKERLDSLYSRVYKISEKVDLIERKIERLERRAGV